eukprot:CAMPEP_0171492048 /NCGR_PEP_ID=MMETSP0958-20121227/4195_1 /TAXON_ID=87120 /ORGANISM="Aurantiochytrium limacinum, Strain ATCCMYA-1381" /LENGTH=100 /DNA_ID=CAMNT_0012025527 /DNA_START=30 /DNA_END=332 /DNA_ORIENTATION=+
MTLAWSVEMRYAALPKSTTSNEAAFITEKHWVASLSQKNIAAKENTLTASNDFNTPVVTAPSCPSIAKNDSACRESINIKAKYPIATSDDEVPVALIESR